MVRLSPLQRLHPPPALRPQLVLLDLEDFFLFSFTFNLKQNVIYFILVFKIYTYLFYMHVYV